MGKLKLYTDRIPKRSATIAAILFVLSMDMFGQETFNTRFALGPSTVACNVHVLDTGFMVSGRASQAEPVFHLRTFISGFDAQGDLAWTKMYGDTTTFYTGMYDVNVKISDSLFVIGCEGWSDGSQNTRLVWFNEQGDTIMTRAYISPSFNPKDEETSDWNKVTAITRDSEGNIYFAAVVVIDTDNLCWIAKLDNNGEPVWNEIIEFGADVSYASALLGTENGVIVTGGYSDQDVFMFFSRLLELSEEGNVLWQIEEEGLDIESAGWNEIIQDGGRFILASSLEIEELGPIPVVLAIQEGEVAWQHTMDSPDETWQRFTNIVFASDGNYVAGGLQHEVFEEEDPLDGIENYNAWLAKFSTEGDLIWDRTYHYVQSTDDEHSLLDLKLCPDGGFVFCGEAEDWSAEAESPKQQGWLVKVDACGCLVPGCDPNCSTSVNDPTEPIEIKPFLVGPNPASQFLNIHVVSQSHNQRRSFQIHTLHGTLLDTFSAQGGGTTYMYDCAKLSSGLYVVSMIEDGIEVGKEKVVVEK